MGLASEFMKTGIPPKADEGIMQYEDRIKYIIENREVVFEKLDKMKNCGLHKNQLFPEGFPIISSGFEPPHNPRVEYKPVGFSSCKIQVDDGNRKEPVFVPTLVVENGYTPDGRMIAYSALRNVRRSSFGIEYTADGIASSIMGMECPFVETDIEEIGSVVGGAFLAPFILYSITILNPVPALIAFGIWAGSNISYKVKNKRMNSSYNATQLLTANCPNPTSLLLLKQEEINQLADGVIHGDIMCPYQVQQYLKGSFDETGYARYKLAEDLFAGLSFADQGKTLSSAKI